MYAIFLYADFVKAKKIVRKMYEMQYFYKCTTSGPKAFENGLSLFNGNSQKQSPILQTTFFFSNIQNKGAVRRAMQFNVQFENFCLFPHKLIVQNYSRSLGFLIGSIIDCTVSIDN